MIWKTEVELAKTTGRKAWDKVFWNRVCKELFM